MEQGPIQHNDDYFFENRKKFMLLSKALKDYIANGKTMEQFEEDYDCKVICNDFGISDIKYNNQSSKTVLKLKYE